MAGSLLLDVEAGALGPLLWPHVALPAATKVKQLAALTPAMRLALVEDALRDAAGKWGELPGWAFWPAVRRILHDGDLPSEAYRWAVQRVAEVEARRRAQAGPAPAPTGPCLVWCPPPPDRQAYIPAAAVQAELRGRPGQWALVFVGSKRRGIEAASRIRLGKEAHWLAPDEWEADSAWVDEERTRSGLWLRYERRREAVAVDTDRRADA